MTPSVVHVVVPAHNEGRRVGSCLRALAAARCALAAARPGLVVSTTLVLDRCSDDTLASALENVGPHPLRLVTINAGCVGSARRHGVRHAVSANPAAAEDTWIVTTDADSTVSESWLIDHVRFAQRHDLVVGRVSPDPDELTPPHGPSRAGGRCGG